MNITELLDDTSMTIKKESYIQDSREKTYRLDMEYSGAYSNDLIKFTLSNNDLEDEEEKLGEIYINFSEIEETIQEIQSFIAFIKSNQKK